jgi:hypothetical protein
MLTSETWVMMYCISLGALMSRMAVMVVADERRGVRDEAALDAYATFTGEFPIRTLPIPSSPPSRPQDPIYPREWC